MTQPERVSSFQGKYFLFLFLVQNGRDKVMDQDALKISSSLPLTDSASVTLELFVDTSYSFPAHFTLVSGLCSKYLKSVESDFTLTFFSTDHNLKIVKFD